MFQDDRLPQIGDEHTFIGKHQTVSQRNPHQQLFGHLVERIVLIEEGEYGEGEKGTHEIAK